MIFKVKVSYHDYGYESSSYLRYYEIDGEINLDAASKELRKEIERDGLVETYNKYSGPHKWTYKAIVPEYHSIFALKHNAKEIEIEELY